MVEHAAVNRRVVGSSPTRGAKFFNRKKLLGFRRSRWPAFFVPITRWNQRVSGAWVFGVRNSENLLVNTTLPNDPGFSLRVSDSVLRGAPG